jgi:ribonuclease HI
MTPLDLILHFDGGVWPNPGGDPHYGWHLDIVEGVRVADGSGKLVSLPAAERTNNTAEFAGLRSGLLWVASFRLATVDRLTVYGDSRLVVEIVAGRWRAKKPHLAALSKQCKEIIAGLDVGHFDISWKPRRENAEADRLAAQV